VKLTPRQQEANVPTDTDTLIEQYRTMMLIRRFEEEAARAYAQGKIGGFLHLYIGQEAIAVGAHGPPPRGLRLPDLPRPRHRARPRHVAERGMAELFGKDTGCSKRPRRLHALLRRRDQLHRRLRHRGRPPRARRGRGLQERSTAADRRVTVCFFGEGATNIGGFHEAMSLAGLWKLPIVFVCENNQYAMGTPMSRTSPIEDLTLKAQGYGMAGDHFEGTTCLRHLGAHPRGRGARAQRRRAHASSRSRPTASAGTP
jgi:pyruvate dehydrogenase E1 component alpha subunit